MSMLTRKGTLVRKNRGSTRSSRRSRRSVKSSTSSTTASLSGSFRRNHAAEHFSDEFCDQNQFNSAPLKTFADVVLVGIFDLTYCISDIQFQVKTDFAKFITHSTLNFFSSARNDTFLFSVFYFSPSLQAIGVSSL